MTDPPRTDEDMLRALEWSGSATGVLGCPACDRPRVLGHTPDCWLGQRLARKECTVVHGEDGSLGVMPTEGRRRARGQVRRGATRR